MNYAAANSNNSNMQEDMFSKWKSYKKFKRHY